MTVTLERFQNLADSARFSFRDIALGDDGEVRLGNFFFSAGKKANAAVMDAFRAALENKYGSLGIHAFDTVLTSRTGLDKSLRACDVKETLSKLQFIREQRFVDELSRQLDTSPKFRQLPEDMRKEIRRAIAGDLFKNYDLASCKTSADVADLAEKRINEEIRKRGGTDLSLAQVLGDREETETAARPDEPTGLRNLKTILGKKSTSIEDLVKKGYIGAGMRINRSSTNPVIFEKLKTNGVEPGFIYHNDWSKDDTHGFMADIGSPGSRAALDNLKKDDRAFADECARLNTDGSPKSLRQQILLAGRAHPAAMAAASEFLLQKAAQLLQKAAAEDKTVDEMQASESVKNLAKALKKQFSRSDDIDALARMDDRPGTRNVVKEAKLELFTSIRDAVMGVKESDAEYAASPVFKHFADRHIMKLDYNEGDKLGGEDAASAGKFRRPERILVSRGAIIGQIYRFTSRQSADKISAGAVTEALANDLTRLAGVPSQELQIVRGQYSDGHPKFMLEAKFARGYKDMEAGFIRDGRIVPPKDKDGNLQELESLGKYKAFFLLTADRDGVGKRGQNKGFADGRFFAIDPGHSLEGNGRYLDISDDFSFKDTFGISVKPRFDNFSVFDDDTRFAKLSGLIELRRIAQSGAFEKLFTDYKAAFNPNEDGISPAERTLRTKICAEIDEKKAEFDQQLSRLLEIFSMQLELNDHLAADGPAMQEGAINTLSHLEMLTSPTTWVSKHGEVALKHLEVRPETRVPWRAGVEGNNIVYHCDKPIPEKARDILQSYISDFGSCTLDALGTTRLVVPKDRAAEFFAAFNEETVQQLTHPEEYNMRKLGGDGLMESALYRPFEPGPK